jgi:hypothetical protein
MSYAYAQGRAKAAHEAAEAADHPRDKAAHRAAAAAWERLARATPGGFSLEPARRQLRSLKQELATATGPFSPGQQPPQAPGPAIVSPVEQAQARTERALHRLRQEATIEF